MRPRLWISLLCALLGAPLLTAPASRASAETPAPADPLTERARSNYARLDTQHQAKTLLLTTLKAEVPNLTLAAKDLTGLTLDLAQRAAVACILAPVDKAELGDVVGAAVETTKIKGCLELLPVGMMEQILKLPEEDRPKVGRVIETAGRIRRGLAILAPQIQALTEETAKATLEFVEIQTKATLDHEWVKNNLFASDDEKAAAAATYALSQAALADCERKLTQIAADLAQFPIDAVTISAEALKAIPASP